MVRGIGQGCLTLQKNISTNELKGISAEIKAVIPIFLKYAKQVLHCKAYSGNGNPTAETEKYRLAPCFDELNNICVKTDGSHCHNDEKLAKSL